MGQKLAVSPTFEWIKHNPKRGNVDLKDGEKNRSLRLVTREEKIREAGKPLYLKRYE